MGLRLAGRTRSANSRGGGQRGGGRAWGGAKTVRAPRSTRHFTTTRAGSAGASSSRATSVARRRCTVRSSSSGRKYAGSPGATSMPKNGDMAPRAVPAFLPVLPNEKAKTCASRRGRFASKSWLIRFHLLCLPSRSPLSFYVLLDAFPIPTVRASLTYPPPRRSPPPASGSTGTIARSYIPGGGKERKSGQTSAWLGRAPATARTRARVSYRDGAERKHAPAPSRSRCGTQAGYNSSAALSRRTA